MMEEKQEIKQGRITKEIKAYETDKKVGELLSSKLSDVQEKFKMSKISTDDLLMSSEDAYDHYLDEYKESINIVVPEIEVIGMTVMTSAVLMNLMEHGHNLMGQDFNNELINSFKSAVSDEQVVVAVGPDCRQVKVGDRIKINFADFFRIINPNTVRAEEVSEVPIEKIGDKKYLSVHERNIKYIFKDEEYYQRRK